MAGTDDEPVAAADDALYVLTAVLLTPAQFPSVLGDDYAEACAALDLAPRADGYGLVLGQDGQGARWTVVIDDVSLVAVAIASWDCGMEYELSPDERAVVTALPGWPLAVAVAAPGVPAPHDPPAEEAGRPALCPPDTGSWGPAQRRLGADEIALQWAAWREQINDADFPVPGGSAQAVGSAQGGEGARVGGHAGVRRVLAEARAYVDSPPPLGRVRSSFAPGEARTLRADGPGWSIVARTDDIAFVLLDEEPGEVLPVGRGPELPGLLEALDKMAVRPL
ncbi:integral membrane protein [Streptomyces hygroscopicus subsp. jinggangensis 5008]|nr:integral membrane protein [Streptomyces hygroscopicus subsp. jinggangensis 5008]AGF62043.1 integral membrane protein [Streptomyces hygroscopicus subsp. jinggangensis TL01]